MRYSNLYRYQVLNHHEKRNTVKASIWTGNSEKVNDKDIALLTKEQRYLQSHDL